MLTSSKAGLPLRPRLPLMKEGTPGWTDGRTEESGSGYVATAELIGSLKGVQAAFHGCRAWRRDVRGKQMRGRRKRWMDGRTGRRDLSVTLSRKRTCTSAFSPPPRLSSPLRLIPLLRPEIVFLLLFFFHPPPTTSLLHLTLCSPTWSNPLLAPPPFSFL